jgi:methionyl-tRNA formyltransferase
LKNILILTDNSSLLNGFIEIIERKKKEINEFSFRFFYSYNNKVFIEKYKNQDWIQPLDIKKELNTLIGYYDLIFSLHCKQLFPKKIVDSVRCINIHPGYNPFNRGWYPQVFSILNNLPCGVTIHEMDEHLDHGPIIYQMEVKPSINDTSETLYNKIVEVELELLDKHILELLYNKYDTIVTLEGNINLRTDFDAICEIDLNDINTFGNHINKMRALSHGKFKNMYFKDGSGNKVFFKIDFFNE